MKKRRRVFFGASGTQNPDFTDHFWVWVYLRFLETSLPPVHFVQLWAASTLFGYMGRDTKKRRDKHDA